MSDNELLPVGTESTPGSGDVGAGRRHVRKRRRGARTALIVLGTLVAVLCLGGVAAVVAFRNSLDNNIEKLADPFEGIQNRPEAAASDPALPDEAVNILVLGSDSRISAGDPSQWKAGAALLSSSTPRRQAPSAMPSRTLSADRPTDLRVCH